MDVHRCRFVPYPPAAINALAFSHSSNLTTLSKGPPTLRLAIGRANGDIEIWNPLRGAWHQESIFQGGKDRSIEGLAWTQDPEEEDKNGVKIPGQLRLFSIGYSDAVTEWDLGVGRPIRHSSGNYGELWCMAAQPRSRAQEKSSPGGINGNISDTAPHQSLAVGCADGSIVLMSTADGDLKFQKTLLRPSKKKARVLSIAWQNSYTVVTGHADSAIRAYDVRSAQQIRSMSLGAGPQDGPKEILVWSVKTMADGTIVSGDSTGTVSFWDGKNYTRLQRITGHKADILDLAVSADGYTVFSGGMDRRTTMYRKTAGTKPGEKERWAEIAHQRFHAHDVKAMTMFETKNISVMATGGLDTAPVIVPVREFGREHHRTLPGLPQQPPIRSARKHRLLLSWWDREVSIWKLLRNTKVASQDEDSEDAPHVPSRKLVAKILIQGDESITSAEIFEDGSLLAVATMSEVRVFHLKERFDSTCRLRKIKIPEELAKTGAKVIQFSPDGKWLLLVTGSNAIQLVRIIASPKPRHPPQFLPKLITVKRIPRKIPIPHALHGTLGPYDRSICRAAFSADSRILVVGDLSGYLDAWVLEGHEDLTQDRPLTNLENDVHTSSSSPSSSSSSSDESDTEDHPDRIYAQQWKRSPTAHLLPRLPSAPLVMSFRPAATSSGLLTNGTTHPHPTRRAPHPPSHDLPSGEDRLFVLTAEHQIYEFDLLRGRISDWSRRNPTSMLPKEFRQIRDRGMGCMWDSSPPSSTDKGRQRIWLYGSAWLWMFDLAQDLPRPNAESGKESGSDDNEKQQAETSKKRKRTREKDIAIKKKRIGFAVVDGQMVDNKSERRKEKDSGAGSKVPTHELNTGVGQRMRKTTGAGGNDTKFIDLSNGQSDGEDESDDEEENGSSALVQLRRGTADEAEAQTQSANGLPFWETLKYRPMLGIVPIGSGNDGDVEGEGSRCLEVALVERPMFEVDLPARYYGDQEWSESKDADGFNPMI
ncbi:MAG: hypothetical protein Q9222_006932 [Ikaeria aurantiellina]